MNIFTAQTGTGNSYIACSFQSVAGANTISNWMLTPQITLNNGDQFKFWTRKPTPAPNDFPDRMQVRLSTNGASTNVGVTNTSVGDFTTLLLDINPTLVVGGYPLVWTQFTITISGLPGPTNGRVAFRYFVTNGGPGGANSDYIGVDTFQYIAAVPTAANVSVGGYVFSPEGRAISRATVQMIDQQGQIRTVKTNTFGFYRFDEVRVGEFYVFNAFAKEYQFASQVVSVEENISEFNFTAQ